MIIKIFQIIADTQSGQSFIRLNHPSEETFLTRVTAASLRALTIEQLTNKSFGALMHSIKWSLVGINKNLSSRSQRNVLGQQKSHVNLRSNSTTRRGLLMLAAALSWRSSSCFQVPLLVQSQAEVMMRFRCRATPSEPPDIQTLGSSCTGRDVFLKPYTAANQPQSL